MFSCLLLRTSKDKNNKDDELTRDHLIADKIDLGVRIVSQVGCGKADCSYTFDKDEHGLVLYVPTLLALRGASRQHLRVTNCRVQSTNSTTGETSSQTLRLSKLSTKAYSTSMHSLPTHTSVKEKYAHKLSQYSGATSSEDLLLHLGDFKACSLLEIHLEFLIKITLFPYTGCSTTGASYPLQYVLYSKVPASYLHYSASLASPLPVQDVTPLVSAAHLNDFSWDHVSSSNVIQVQYECAPGQDDPTHLAFSSGFSVHLAPGTPSGCCTLTYPSHSSANEASSSKTVTPVNPGSAVKCDGIMMLNNTLTHEQFPPSVRERPLHLSEYVFVIDCSGSMSGSNIQAATDTLVTCVKSLPTGSYFNIIAFGSNFRQLFHTSAEYTKRSVERAVQFANQMQASLGGTELLTPLRWIYKKPLCEGLPRQIFIVTDGGVSNTQHVLHTVRKNRHQARCHTFGIGPDVCTELVTGIAAASGGRCVLLQDGERLQTKVIEVLKESLQPSISDSILRFSPPDGYSVLDNTPRSLGTLYTGSSHTAFAFIKRDGTTRSHKSRTRVCEGSVSVTGQTGNKQVELDIESVTLPALTASQSHELALILDRVAVWSKLNDMEMQLMTSSRKNSLGDEKLQEPEAKRIKLNGVNHSSPAGGRTVDADLSEELVQLSLCSGIPCGLTCFRGDKKMMQILPYQQTATNRATSSTHNSRKMTAYQSQKRIAQLQKMQNRTRRKQEILSNHSAPLSSQPLSVTSLAKSTLTSMGSTLKTVANTFGMGLVFPEVNSVIENGQRIEDHLEFENQKKSALYWDDTKGKLVYPPSYYLAHDPKAVSKSRCSETKQTSAQSKTPHSVALSTPYPLSMTRTVSGSKEKAKSSSTSSTPVSTDSSSSDDEDFVISDTESNSSLDPDWDDLCRPAELRPLIQMQLYSGAWPMVRAFSYAVGVPLDEVRKLLVKDSEGIITNSMSTKATTVPHINGTAQEDDDQSNVWTTALAIACMEEYFPHLKAEWEIVALKGQLWLEQNLPQASSLCASQVSVMAKKLVSKWV